MVFIWSAIVLGNFHPVRCRMVATCVGMACIVVAYEASSGLSVLCGFGSTDVH